MKIGQRIRQLRNERGLSQFKLAVEMGATPYQIYTWEVGRTRPRKQSIERICAALGVPLSEFVKGVDIHDIWRSANLENSKGGKCENG